MAATKLGSVAAVLLVLPAALALGSHMKRARDCPPVCAILHREFNSMNCTDPELGPQRNVSCQEKYYRICKNSCTNTPPTDLECYRASGYFVHSDSCEQIDNKIAQLQAERLEKGCRENHENVLRVRLMGGSGPNEGRVEVKLDNGTWGTLCHSYWGTADAQVVCRWAGFPSDNPKAWSTSAHHFGRGTLDSVQYYLHCSGNEETLFDCSNHTSYPWGTGACGSSSYKAAGVTCLTN